MTETGMDQRGYRRRPTAEEMRTRILDVAEEHFRRAGVHKTSLGDIAAELGMSAANIYRFFPSREAINGAICERVVRRAEDITAAIMQSEATASEKLERLLHAIHRHNMTLLADHTRLHELIVLASKEHWDIMDAHASRMRANLAQIMRQGIEAGEFNIENPAEAARATMTACAPFLNPLLIGSCVQNADNAEVDLFEHIRFIRRALVGTSANNNVDIASI